MSPPVPEHEVSQRQLFDLSGRTVLVMGLGESGQAMARWAHARGARLRLADTRPEDAVSLSHLPALRAELGEPATFCGAFDEAWLEDIDLVAWSPGLSLEMGESAAFAARAREKGIAIAGELDLFIQALAELAEAGYRPRLVAITGTNGKTTTTALAAHLFAACGRSVRAAGNIGPALLAALGDAVASDGLPDIWVLELSSFQLAASQGFEPDVATILNLTEDHLDWHVDMASYAAAKRRIHGGKAWVVSNRDDPLTEPDTPAPAADTKPTGGRAARRQAQAPIGRKVSRFGLDAPRAAGDFGLVHEGGMAWLVAAEPEDDLPGKRTDQPQSFHVRRLMPAEALPLVGQHNQANFLAALALGAALGLPLAPMLRAARDFRLAEHRCEEVACVSGVSFINDSKGTNVGATVAALGSMERGCVLIAGGVGKGQDFAPLARAAARREAQVLLIGKDAAVIAAALDAESVQHHACANLEDAVRRGMSLASPQGTVLLSPACASFDMFRDYADRGEAFRRAVRDCAISAGQPLELAC